MQKRVRYRKVNFLITFRNWLFAFNLTQHLVERKLGRIDGFRILRSRLAIENDAIIKIDQRKNDQTSVAQ